MKINQVQEYVGCMIWTWNELGLQNFVQVAYAPIWVVRCMKNKCFPVTTLSCLLRKNFTGEWKSLHVVAITRESMK